MALPKPTDFAHDIPSPASPSVLKFSNRPHLVSETKQGTGASSIVSSRSGGQDRHGVVGPVYSPHTFPADDVYRQSSICTSSASNTDGLSLQKTSSASSRAALTTLVSFFGGRMVSTLQNQSSSTHKLQQLSNI